MFIEVINVETLNIRNSTEQNLARIQAIEHLLQIAYNRKHIVLFNRATLDFIIDSDEIFGVNSRTQAQDIRYKLTEIGGIKHRFKIKMEVDFSDATAESSSKIGDRELIKVNYRRVIDHETLQTPVILGENLDDAKLYLHLSRLYLISSGSHDGISINMNTDHGGGSTTINKFRQLKEQEKICLCILDSDKKFPTDSEKGTSSAFTNIERQLDKRAKAIVLDAHEIESIIPDYILRDVFSDYRYPEQYTPALDLLSSINEYRKFFDHKNGISLKQAINLAGSSQTNYWHNAFSRINTANKLQCFGDVKCYQCDDCPKLLGFGERLLSNTVNLLETGRPVNSYRNHVTQTCINTWSQFAEVIVQWGCVLKERRTVT